MIKDQAKERRFTKGSGLVLTFCAILILLDVIQVINRFQVPTDGWSWYTGAYGGKEEAILVYDKNLIGEPSPLQPGDRVLAVAGLPVSGGDLNQIHGARARLAGTQVGSQVEYSILRGDQALTIAVPLAHWTLASWFRAYIVTPSFLVSSIVNLLLIGIGLFTFWKRPALLSARALLLWCTAVTCMQISSSLPDNVYNILYPVGYWGTLLFSYTIFIWLLGPALLAFTLVFPKPKTIVQRHAWIVVSPFFIGLLILVVILFNTNLGVLGWIGTMLMLLASAINLVHSAFTQRDAVSRAQLRWAVGGVILGIAVSLLTYLPAFNLVSGELADILGSSFTVGFAIIAISLSIAILRYRLWDIDLIINRTLVYLPLTAILAGLYSASITLLQKLFISTTGSKSDAAVVVTTFLLVTTFTPVKNWLQSWVDRHFKDSHDPIKAIHGFDNQVRAIADVLDTQTITGRLLDTAITAFHATGGAVYLQQAGEVIQIHASPKWRMDAASISLPLEWNNQTYGTLYLMGREVGRDFSDEERKALQQAANQVARIISNFALEPLTL